MNFFLSSIWTYQTRHCQYSWSQEQETGSRRSHGTHGNRVGDAPSAQLPHLFNCNCTASPACSCYSRILVHLQDPFVVHSDVQRQDILRGISYCTQIPDPSFDFAPGSDHPREMVGHCTHQGYHRGRRLGNFAEESPLGARTSCYLDEA